MSRKVISMNLPAYDSPIYERAMEIISMDFDKVDAYDRTARSIAVATDDRLPALRDQLNALIHDAVLLAQAEAQADDHGDIF